MVSVCGRREDRGWKKGTGAHLGVSVMFLDMLLGAQMYSVGEDKSSDRLVICALFCIYVILR